MIESTKDLIYVICEYGILFQENGIHHETYNPVELYRYFLKKMKVVTRNTQDAIILSAAKSQDNFNPHLLEALG